MRKSNFLLKNSEHFFLSSYCWSRSAKLLFAMNRNGTASQLLLFTYTLRSWSMRSMNVGEKLILKSYLEIMEYQSLISNCFPNIQYFCSISFWANSFSILMTHRRVESMKDFTTSQWQRRRRPRYCRQRQTSSILFFFPHTDESSLSCKRWHMLRFHHSLGCYECGVFFFRQRKYT